MENLKGACIIGQSGGPTAVINASAQGVIQTALASDQITRVLGAAHGIKGVLADQLYDMSQEDPAQLDLLQFTPSSALGSCRYKLADPDVDDTDYQRILEIFKKYDVRYFFYNGGNESMDTCNKISKYMQRVGYPCNIIGVPKTIDNDLDGTDHCPGYASAAKYIATSCMELYQDARVYDTGTVVIVEIMGHKVGWLALYAGIAGGADIILLPEIPYDIDVVVNAIRSRTKNGKNFTILAVAEGAISKENAALTKKELKEKKKNGPVYPSVAYELGAQISERTGQEIRVTVPGHMQRGGEPCPYDRVIATRLGAEAAEMIRRKEYGYMVALNNNKIEKIPLADIAGKLKMVDPKSDIIREAKDVGISFGDE